ncbi:MAG: hypothetical protein KAR55_02125 [Thermoplasmatales archaeon]|nr:hypothetical protein [Thermoplasmatales archaeon]
MNKKIIVLVMASIFLLMSVSSVSAIYTTENTPQEQTTGEGTGYLQVIVLDIHGIPFFPPAGWAIEVRRGDPDGEIMVPDVYKDGTAVFQTIPLDMYFIKVSANLYRDLNVKVQVYKEYIPGDPSTIHTRSIKYRLRDLKTSPVIHENPFLIVLLQQFFKIFLIK